ncbi:hypothetical protein DXX93_11470 [Thalassotalea euphylliae]|uniref:Uncharacterized protein n=1 Tax=Thalassotalea euphylliae TaxID=1655234 RepID=A0A3E0TRL6_9GAMM|nr:hypothetical protein [Thalassotalea euphylliae]REL27123.1 hypothetical protein DXX93_11470 [Thalassotalea euphylliae]
MKPKLLLVVLLFLAFFKISAFANQQALNIERLIPENFELAFPNEQNRQPRKSDFAIVSYALMSNQAGERWAVVTIRNLASGWRMLDQKHILALTANGERISPLDIEQHFKAEETLSLTINFGRHKFPLLSIYSKAD